VSEEQQVGGEGQPRWVVPDMPIEAFDYDLPPEAIAHEPIEPRRAARLLVARRGHPLCHARVEQLPVLLEPGDLVVVNESAVIPARLRLHRRTGAQVEVLLLRQRADGLAEALVRPNRRVREGEQLLVGSDAMVEVGGVVEAVEGITIRSVRILDPERVAAVGVAPLPPYLARQDIPLARYQTVYARQPGSVAAPTAGLHLDDVVLAGLAARGVEVASVVLHVGLGTFWPVSAATLANHPMHAESYEVDEEVWARIQAAPRVVAIGTTVVRTLETVALTGELAGESRLLIAPGFRFRVVDTVLTNFHQPRSTLVALVAAMVGERWRSLYAAALAEGYRFLSFGDAMLVDVEGRR
jgi:S-adenosylmethionine:tRNA ribosyltransferase-isomerase